MLFLNFFDLFPFTFNLGIESMSSNKLFILCFNCDFFFLDHLFDKELAITDLADLSTWHVHALREYPCLEPALGTVGQGTELTVSSVFIWLVLLLAAIAERILNRAGNVIWTTQFEYWVTVYILEILDIFFTIRMVIHLNYELLRSLDHLLKSHSSWARRWVLVIIERVIITFSSAIHEQLKKIIFIIKSWFQRLNHLLLRDWCS